MLEDYFIASNYSKLERIMDITRVRGSCYGRRQERTSGWVTNVLEGIEQWASGWPVCNCGEEHTSNFSTEQISDRLLNACARLGTWTLDQIEQMWRWIDSLQESCHKFYINTLTMLLCTLRPIWDINAHAEAHWSGSLNLERCKYHLEMKFNLYFMEQQREYRQQLLICTGKTCKHMLLQIPHWYQASNELVMICLQSIQQRS